MLRELRYGERGMLRFDVPSETVLADCTEPHGQPLGDPQAAAAAALANPLNFPPLAQAVMPGDRVVLALDPEVPQAEAVVAGVIEVLLQAGTEPGQITIVSPHTDCPRRQACTALLPPAVQEAIELRTHDPCDHGSLAYLAASQEGNPVYLNRVICDADVVVPISSLRFDAALGYVGVHGGLFPTFSDEATQRRFRVSNAGGWTSRQQQQRREANEVAWLLGVQMTVQIVPGPGDTILHILAGEAEAVTARGRALCEAAWRCDVPQRASLVVATIEGGREQQTWENFARALFAASRAVADEGAIVLCTELRCQPGPALQRLTAAEDEEDVMRKIRRDRSPDALPASLLAEARQRVRVYLLSGLDDELVEDLGLGYISAGEEIARLSRQHDSCILLGNAQHAMLMVQDETA